MASPNSVPAGIDFGALASMQQHTDSNVHSAAATPSSDMIGIGGEMMPHVTGSIDIGIGGEPFDFSKFTGSLDKSLVPDFGNMEPFGM